MSATTTAPQRAIARASTVSFAGSAAGAALGIALVIVLGRTLGDAGAGVVLQAIAIFTIALGVARAGMDSAALWILPRLAEETPSALHPTVIRLVAASGVVGTICALVLVSGAFGTGTVSDAVRAIAWFVPIAAMLVTALACTRALGGVLPYTLVWSVGLPAARPAAIAIAVAAGGGLVAASVAWAVPTTLGLIAAIAVLAVGLSRRAGEPRERFVFRGSGLSVRIGRYAAPRVVSESLSQLLIWLDVLIVGAIAGPAAAGVYGAATRIASAGSLVDQAIRVVVAPVFSRLLHQDDRAGLASVFRAATTWLVLFSAPIYLLLAAFAPVALSVVGDAFVHGEAALITLAAGSIVSFLAGNVHSVLLMSGRSGLAAGNKVFAVALDVALLFLFVPHHGIAGAALAWAIACAADALLATIEVRYLLGLRLPLASGLRALGIASATVGVAAIASRWVFGPTWLGLAVAIAVGGGALVVWARAASAVLDLDAFAAHARGRRDSGASS